MTIFTILLASKGVFGGGGCLAAFLPKNEEALKKWLRRLVDAVKRLVDKAVGALHVIVESVVGAILNFHAKAVGFVSEHTWALTVSVAGLLWLWLMQKVKR